MTTKTQTAASLRAKADELAQKEAVSAAEMKEARRKAKLAAAHRLLTEYVDGELAGNVAQAQQQIDVAITATPFDLAAVLSAKGQERIAKHVHHVALKNLVEVEIWGLSGQPEEQFRFERVSTFVRMVPDNNPADAVHICPGPIDAAVDRAAAIAANNALAHIAATLQHAQQG